MRTRFGELILGPVQTTPRGDEYRCVHILDMDRQDARTLCGNRPSENVDTDKGKMWIPYEDKDACGSYVFKCLVCHSVQ